MKKAYLLFLLGFTCLFLQAQNNEKVFDHAPKTKTAVLPKNVKVIGNIYLDSLVERNIEKNSIHQTLDGYRVQLFSGSDRNNAHALRLKFRAEFPDEQSYLIYQQPYFKLRVGDYRNLIEAQQMYHQLQKSYEQILIVPDKINLPRL